MITGAWFSEKKNVEKLKLHGIKIQNLTGIKCIYNIYKDKI